MNDLTVKQINNDLPELEQIKSLYFAAFPEDERVEFSYLLNKAQTGAIALEAYYDGHDMIGLSCVIPVEKAGFLFYFAVNQSLRSRGYGSKILELLKASYPDGLVLDVEAPLPEAENYFQRIRRIEFYNRSGFTGTGHRYKLFGETYELLTNISGLTAHDCKEILSQGWRAVGRNPVIE